MLSTIGLAFLLFLGGLELDLRRLRGQVAVGREWRSSCRSRWRGACGFALPKTLGLVNDALLAAVS